ncbi:Polygalacturonase inhibitor [Spatholobus suberectus]|nr:Polygalacturonase inhibitor [Spatholobus suberectus]
MASTMLRSSLLLILLSTVASELCNPEDKKVLLQIKNDLNNPYLLASWDPNTDCCHCCCVLLFRGLVGSVKPKGGERGGDINYWDMLNVPLSLIMARSILDDVHLPELAMQLDEVL